MSILWLDTETFSELDLKVVGTYRYASQCEIMLITWAVNEDGPVQIIDMTRGDSTEAFRRALAEALEVWAHKAMFDRTVLSRHGFSAPRAKWRDTMVQALCHGLPGALGTLSDIYKLGDAGKDKEGKKLLQLFCKPRPKNSKIRRATRETHPEKWAAFSGSYAVRDVEAMRTLHYKMPRWNYPNNVTELSHWHLDQLQNDRGFCVDVPGARAMIAAIKRETAHLDKLTEKLTNGDVERMTQRDRFLAHLLRNYGFHLPDLTKDTVKKAVGDAETPAPVREMLRLRQQSSASSTAKYTALINRVDDDSRARGTVQFAGAARTARAAGRGIQPQNLPSRGLPPDWMLDEGIHLAHLGCEDLVFSNVMKIASGAVRKMIVAPPGKKFCVSDLAGIENRKVAWFAGEDTELAALRAFDAGTGPDLYIVTYANAFQVDIDSVTDTQRNIGKVMTLMLGYGGGVGAFVKGAASYGFDLEQLALDIRETLPPSEIDEARNSLEWVKDTKRDRYGLSDLAFVAVDVLKRLWRKSHPRTVALWADLEAAARDVLIGRGPRTVGRVVFDKKGSWLRIKLPSGRYLCYPHAKWTEGEGLSYWGIDQHSFKWSRIRSWGGKMLENISQASARDILYNAMPPLEGMGYEIVLHVHDEVVCETPDTTDFTEQMVSAALVDAPVWADGLPLAAKGFETYKYKKG